MGAQHVFDVTRELLTNQPRQSVIDRLQEGRRCDMSSLTTSKPANRQGKSVTDGPHEGSVIICETDDWQGRGLLPWISLTNQACPGSHSHRTPTSVP